ncbi:ABC transporter permease [Kaistia dalseonensis]|uniref:ABC transport system permease protein n=1 Tax=Kaistia dalseonensis TaxID=410840 RepID=A0ABU0H4D4_9HYPH|nr:ABC transporter permease [Kaistia dalseonensis]MCX5494306.1 ABC transporter permease [Kaistia dalseonensis]MDQ0436887.1 putative ABC transport system permease protein [Kaistia dalseonensis]
MRAMVPLPLRFALRELRGGLSGFVVFLACIALGVAAIAAVGSVSRAMTDGLARQGQAILGGDMAFTLVQRQASPEERAFLAGKGTVSEIASLRGMARKTDGSDQTLVEIKAIDAAYPLYGRLVVVEGGTQPAAERPLDAVADEELFTRLGLKVGDTINVGSAQLRLSGMIADEPDKLATGLGFGPRLMLSEAGLAKTELIQPGSLVQWSYRLKLPPSDDAAVARITEEANKTFPQAGWQIRTRDDASPGLKRNIGQFAQYLTLVGLAALIVGGVGVANAVGSFLDVKRPVIATLRSLGAPGRMVVATYLIQIMLIAGLGVAIGLVIGALVPIVALQFLADVLPVGAETGFYPGALAIAAIYGLMTALTFALMPLGQARDIAPTALFRDGAAAARARLRPAFVAAAIASAGILAALAVLLAYDRRIALMFVVAIAAAFLLLRLVGLAVTALARRAPRSSSTEWRFAVGNIHRPGALTHSVVLSLGLGLTVLVTIALIDGSLQRQLTRSLPERAPGFFFLDVQNSELDAFTSFLKQERPDATIESVPMLRGRIIDVAGTPAANVKPAPDIAWVMQGDRGITFSAAPPKNARVVAGNWWATDYAGPPLVSIELGVARGLGLKLGDTITVNVLGRDITATVANLREVEWESLAINFVMVFSPSTFAGAPFSALATLAYPGGDPAADAQLMRDVGKAFPAVTAIRVRDALDRISSILGQLMLAIRVASSIAVAASVLVLAGALAAGHRRRLHDAVILKTLGATRRQLLTAFGLEYGLLGIATALFGVVAGTLAAWGVVAGVMKQSFVFLPSAALGAAVGAVLLTIALGLVGTWRLLGQKAAPVLRNL